MRYYEDYRVDDVPMLIPDADVALSFADLDDSDSGRDESGVMHRIVVRERVRTWGFNYSQLTTEEYLYMTKLFAGKGEFSFRFKDADGTFRICQAYCSNHSITLHNAKLGIYKNLKFNIIEC